MGKPYARASSTPSAAPEAVDRWVHEVCALTEPDRVHWCTGTEQENAELTAQLLATGELERLNDATYPGSYLYRSHPSAPDVRLHEEPGRRRT